MFCKKCGQKIFIIRNEGKDLIFQCSNTQCQEFRKEHRLSMITVLDKTDPTATENNKNSNSVYASDNVNPDTKCKPFTSTPSDVEAGNTLSPVTPVHQAEHHKYGAQSNDQNVENMVNTDDQIEIINSAGSETNKGSELLQVESPKGSVSSDRTTATVSIPNTGKSIIILFFVLISIAVAVVFYFKTKKYNV